MHVFAQICKGGFQAVHGGTHNATCIACPLAYGVESRRVFRLQALTLPPYTAGRGGTRLNAGQDSSRVCKAPDFPVKIRQSTSKSLCDESRQTAVQIRRPDPRPVCGGRQELLRAGCARQKIPHRLHRCPIITAPQLKGQMLQLLLEFQAGEHLITEVSWADLHQQRTVGNPGITPVIAHAVGDNSPRFRGSGHHQPSGAHAEGIGPPPGHRLLVSQGIIRRRQALIARILTVLGLIYKVLGMLNAHPHGKRLGFHGKAPLQQHAVGIPGGMADAEKRRLAGNTLLPCNNQCFQPAVLPTLYIRHTGPKTHPPAQADNLQTNLLHDAPQEIRADMGLMQIFDFLRCPRRHKAVQHLRHQRVAYARGQLAVREGARAAFAELHIGIRQQAAFPPESFNVTGPGIYILAALQHQGA